MAAAVWLFLSASVGFGGTFTVFGPENFIRPEGTPTPVTRSFSVLNPQTTFTLHIDNGDPNGSFRAASNVRITLNGTEIVSQQDLKEETPSLDVTVVLKVENQLTIEIRGGGEETKKKSTDPPAGVTLRITGVDNDPPLISANVNPAPNQAGWNNSDVTVSFICSDSISGIVTCPAPVFVSAETGGQLISGTATDNAGNSASAAVTVRLDKTPPVLSIASPTEGATVFASPVSVLGTVTDALSGVSAVACDGIGTSQTGPSFNCGVTLQAGSNTLDMEATDLAENTRTVALNLTYNPAPTVTFTSPGNLSYLNLSPTTVTGTVSDPTATLTINSLPTPVANGQFSMMLPLAEGPNLITATAISVAGAVGTSSIQVTLDTTPPHVTITSPPDRFVTADDSISIAGNVNDIVVGTVNDQQALVTVNGIPAQVANRTFLATNVPLQLGENVIQAVARDRVGNFATTQIVVTREAPSPSRIRLLSGNNQTGTIGSLLSEPLIVVLTDQDGNPAPNKPVIFKVVQNNGLVQAGGAPAPSLIANTDEKGQAQVVWTLGMRAGAGGNVIEVYSVGFGGTAVFTATGTQGPPGKIVVDTGNNQVGAVNEQLPKPFIAVVVDDGNNRLPGVPVTFSVKKGGGSFAGQPTTTVITDSDGRAAAVLKLGFEEGNANNLVEADFPSNQRFPAAFTASGRTPRDPRNTRISGVVLDNSDVPISGVTVRAVLTNQLNSNLTIVQSATPVQTDEKGQFTIPKAPIGIVKLLVDGNTAQRPGIYPTLDYDMVTVAGQNNTVGAPIFLLPLKTDNQLCVTATTGGGTLTIPEAPGFSLTFGPGQVTFPGGSQDGCISVSTVHGDKVPMEPGFGQQPRFIVTIQPAGAIFNPPAAITLPNVDGLAPRAVTEMYSYDHDIGSFVAIGTGRVSDDGQLIRSNPGVGVLKAGWHCGGDPQTWGRVADCPPCEICQGSPTSTALCVPDPGQESQPCDSPLNDCIDGGTCNGSGECVGGVFKPPGTECNAGGESTAECDGMGVCRGIGDQCPPNCATGNVCLLPTCSNGICGQTPVPDEPITACDAGGSVAGTCVGGHCTGTGDQCPVDCDDSDPLTVDYCADGICRHIDPDDGFCTGRPPGVSCGMCRNGATCSISGMCTGGTPTTGSCGSCMVGGECGSNGRCVGGTPVANGTPCENGGVCFNGSCSAGPVTVTFDVGSVALLRGESKVLTGTVMPPEALGSLEFIVPDPRVVVSTLSLSALNAASQEATSDGRFQLTLTDQTSTDNPGSGPDTFGLRVNLPTLGRQFDAVQIHLEKLFVETIPDYTVDKINKEVSALPGRLTDLIAQNAITALQSNFSIEDRLTNPGLGILDGDIRTVVLPRSQQAVSAAADFIATNLLPFISSPPQHLVHDSHVSRSSQLKVLDINPQIEMIFEGFTISGGPALNFKPKDLLHPFNVDPLSLQMINGHLTATLAPSPEVRFQVDLRGTLGALDSQNVQATWSINGLLTIQWGAK